MKISTLFNRILQFCFGYNDRQAMKLLARKNTIAIFYRGMQTCIKIDSPQNFAKDKSHINQMLMLHGFKGKTK